jgi:hypothetical protein
MTMEIALKIEALEEYSARLQSRPGFAVQALQALGMVQGLKATLEGSFDEELALACASEKLAHAMEAGSADLTEAAVGYFAGIVFARVDNVNEAMALASHEKENLQRLH